MLLLLIFLNVNRDVKMQGEKSSGRIWIFKKTLCDTYCDHCLLIHIKDLLAKQVSYFSYYKNIFSHLKLVVCRHRSAI